MLLKRQNDCTPTATPYQHLIKTAGESRRHAATATGRKPYSGGGGAGGPVLDFVNARYHFLNRVWQWSPIYP